MWWKTWLQWQGSGLLMAQGCIPGCCTCVTQCEAMCLRPVSFSLYPSWEQLSAQEYSIRDTSGWGHEEGEEVKMCMHWFVCHRLQQKKQRSQWSSASSECPRVITVSVPRSWSVINNPGPPSRPRACTWTTLSWDSEAHPDVRSTTVFNCSASAFRELQKPPHWPGPLLLFPTQSESPDSAHSPH